MKKYILETKHIAFFCLSLIPFFSLGQEVIDLKSKSVSQAEDSILISKYLRSIESSRSSFKLTPKNDSPIKLNFRIPRVRIYNAADYYADGKFAHYPFNSWGPYQVPFHLNQPIIVPLKEK